MYLNDFASGQDPLDMTELEEFSRFNVVYERMLRGAKPARSTVQVSALPLGVKLELDAIASRRVR